MQTFLPYRSYVKSARALDNKRLGKQRVETLQILNVLTGNRIANPKDDPDEWVLGESAKGWGNHPMTRMWQGYEVSLLRYGLIVCHVWHNERGFRDTCAAKMRFIMPEVTMSQINQATPPPWLGRDDFHWSHQGNLVRKDPDFYGEKFPGMKPSDTYIWPV